MTTEERKDSPTPASSAPAVTKGQMPDWATAPDIHAGDEPTSAESAESKEGFKGVEGVVIDPVEPAEPQPTTIVPGMSNLQFYLIFVGLNVAVFLAALDQTIVSVALQAIATEFTAQDQVAWVATAYLLTSTAFIPSYGQLADIFGRKSVFLFAIMIFEVGSAMCGVATSMPFLIVARAVAGLGGGGIFSLVIIIIADLVPIRNRAKWTGVIGAGYGLASVAGPLLGGAFVDHVSWRWVFYINLPLGALAVVAIVFFLNIKTIKSENMLEDLAKIDWIGSFVLMVAVICLLIPLQGGGTQYAWNSPIVISLFVVGGVFLAVFVFVEMKIAARPIVPPRLFNDSKVVATFLTAAFFGAAFFGLIFYVPQWFQVVKGDSATSAGIRTLPLIIALVLCSVGTGMVSSATGLAWGFIPAGSVITSLAAVLIGQLTENSKAWEQVIYILIGGIGAGTTLQMIILVGQFTVPEDLLSTMTSLITFFQTIGAVLGLTAVSVAFNQALPTNVARSVADANATLHFSVPGVDLDLLLKAPSLIRVALPEEEWPPVIHGFVVTLQLVFRILIPFAAASALSSLFMKRERLPSGVERPLAF
ncbi:major facilitator superfamily domain-containing protein [Zopfochytrium polystomum]|nr:major facilitator superfamily domain-containing protein [Zopfochytrium polystomum]